MIKTREEIFKDLKDSGFDDAIIVGTWLRDGKWCLVFTTSVGLDPHKTISLLEGAKHLSLRRILPPNLPDPS